MAKNFHTDNKAFMLYKDWEDIFQALDSSEEIGELVMALFAYAKRGETPKLSGGAKIAFLMMRAAIERDGIAWEEMCAQRSECGKKGGRPKKSDESGNTDEKAEQTAASADNAEEKPQGIHDTAEKPKALSQTKRFSEKAKKADKDIDIDKDKDTDIDIDTDKDKDKDKAIDKEKKKDAGTAESVVRSFGTHKNILLTSEQYNELFEITTSDKTYFAYDENEKTKILKMIGNKKFDIQRSKGLGENEAEMMSLTTMDPATRRLIKIEPDDIEQTQWMFDMLLGDDLQGRKDFITNNGVDYLDMADIS